MTTSKVDFTGVKMTLLATLYCRAIESREPQPILGDRISAEILQQVDYDFSKMRKANGDRYTIVIRAKQLDDWVTEFVTRHPDATVVHLACGLDSRAFRLDLPAGVRWFDLDFPDVIALRRQVYPDRHNYQLLASSATDSGWLAEVPTDRPTLVVAEGLLMYLHEAEVRQLLQQVTEHFPTGELMFDVLSPWLTRLVGFHHWGLRDPHEVERWLPGVQFVDEATVVGSPYAARIPTASYRRLFRAMRPFPALRGVMRLERFAF